MFGASIIGGKPIRLILLVSCGFVLQLLQTRAQQTIVQEVPSTSEDASPFLLLGVQGTLNSLSYTWPNPEPNGDLIPLHTDSNRLALISGIAYHYRRRLIFWATNGGTLYTATFQNHTSITNIKTEQVIAGRFFDPTIAVGDLAVDWINDKLYWTERDKGRIIELDLETNDRRTAVTTDSTAVLNGLVMYPYPGQGWIYWTGTDSGKIERSAVTEGGIQLVKGGLQRCIWPIEIDYSEQKVYWVNTCQNTLKSVSILESKPFENRVEINSAFVGMNSMTLFGDLLFWNENGNVKVTNKSINSGEVIQIYENRDTVFRVAVEVVHPSKQPGEREFIEIIHENVDMETLNETCPVCVNGRCVPPGFCVCHTGWLGANCTTDFDECAANVSKCEQECHNTDGSYYCSCNSTSYLDSDGITCIPGEPSYAVEFTVSSNLGLQPEETPTGDYESASVTTNTAAPIQSTHVATSTSPSQPSSSVATFDLNLMSTLSVATSDINSMSTSTIATSDLYVMSSSYDTVSTLSSTTSTVPSSKVGSRLPEPSLSVSQLVTSSQTDGQTSSSTKGTATSSESQTESSSFSLFTHKSPTIFRTTTTYLSYSVSEQVAIVASSSSSHLYSISTSVFLSTSTGSFSSSASPSLSFSLSATLELTPSPSSTIMTSHQPSSTLHPTTTFSSLPATQISTAVNSLPLSSSLYASSSLAIVPHETPTAEAETTEPEVVSSTDSLPGGAKPTSSSRTLIVIVSAAGGSCAILIIVVLIMIIVAVHYATKRCGSYTVNPDPSKESGLPSWVAVHSGSPTNHVNGISHHVKSNFRTQSPVTTSSTNSFST